MPASGRSLIELKARLYNRTPYVQTFLWWANVATRVHEQYQSFFPPDVRYVADHAKRAMTRFRAATGAYYGVDYPAACRRQACRRRSSRASFRPDGRIAPNDLSWYANIPVPTSYMITATRRGFFRRLRSSRAEAGVVHVANHHIAPGKKQWTWGNHEFGYAWDRSLTDDDGPYIELMAGVYTDNQPDFSFLAPGETRTFSQYWYPIREIGPVQQATVEAAASLNISGGSARIGLCVTQAFSGLRVSLESHGGMLAQWECELAPGRAFVQAVNLPTGIRETELTLRVVASTGRELLRYSPALPGSVKRSRPPPSPRFLRTFAAMTNSTSSAFTSSSTGTPRESPTRTGAKHSAAIPVTAAAITRWDSGISGAANWPMRSNIFAAPFRL